jgi:hypothetical protein
MFKACIAYTHITLPKSSRASCLGIRYLLARGAFTSFCRSFMFVSFAWLRWSAYGVPARLADSTSWISFFATTRWSVVTLDPGKKADEQPLLLLVDTTMEGASPTHARQE